MTGSTVCGVLVGGGSRRMGGTPKGLLAAPGREGETLVARLVRVAREAGCEPVLVGDAGAYAHEVPAVARWEDAPAGVGPLGGMRALLAGAAARGAAQAIALACDMPFVSREAFAYLRGWPSGAAVVCARRAEGAPWEPMFARYEPARVLPVIDRLLARGERSLQALLREAGAEAFELPEALARAVRDWDTPEDVRADVRADGEAGAISGSGSGADGGGGPAGR